MVGIELMDKIVGALPLTIESANQYFGSFVCFNLIDANGRKLTFRIYLCDWKDSFDNEIMAASSIDARLNNQHFASLSGRTLTAISFPQPEAVILLLDSGERINLEANFEEYERNDELFMIRFDDGYSIDYSPQSGFRSDLQ
ncbi:MAG: hypothetical protein K0R43_186 [Pseudoduganella sp.]|jgi:hypothetical protein|nr:hypothetical protein [Pseudoduganella sp.]